MQSTLPIKLFVASLLFLHFACNLASQNGRIIWSNKSKLRWSDFKVRSDSINDDRMAVSVIGLNFKFTERRQKIVIKSYASFNLEKSWVKESARKALVLDHEQSHFNLAEYYLRVFRSTIIANASKINDEEDVRSLLQEVNASYRKETDIYERETNFYRNLRKDSVSQVKWDKFILHKLDSLSSFSKNRIIIKIED